MTEPQKMIFLGALDVSQDEALALNIPPGADADTVRAAILKANAERAAAAKKESEALAEMFLNKLAIDEEQPK